MERKRAVCRVYTRGTGLEKMRSQVSHASFSRMILLSISTFFFSSMGSRSMAPESMCSARSGLWRASRSVGAASSPKALRTSEANLGSLAGSDRCAHSERGKAQTQRPSSSSPLAAASSGASFHSVA